VFYLNSFAKLNRLACEHALHLLVDQFLEEKDNVIDKKMKLLTSKQGFFV
jgi:hypothetical protein